MPVTTGHDREGESPLLLVDRARALRSDVAGLKSLEATSKHAELFRTRAEDLPQDQDYVLVVRPGLAEAVEARGFDWLGERVDEILGKAAA